MKFIGIAFLLTIFWQFQNIKLEWKPGTSFFHQLPFAIFLIIVQTFVGAKILFYAYNIWIK